MHTHTHTHTYTQRMLRSIFKQSLTGLNSKFSFSQTGCHTTVKSPVYPTIYS